MRFLGRMVFAGLNRLCSGLGQFRLGSLCVFRTQALERHLECGKKRLRRGERKRGKYQLEKGMWPGAISFFTCTFSMAIFTGTDLSRVTDILHDTVEQEAFLKISQLGSIKTDC